MLFGQTLHILRITKGARQKRVAFALGVDQSYVSQIESGRKSPPKSPLFVEQISAELGLSDAERTRLVTAAEVEHCLGDMADGASAEQASFGLTILKNLRNLNAAKIEAIEAILRL